MSAMTTDDRWTCPTCNHTEHLQMVTTERRARARMRQVQIDHARVHRQEILRAMARGVARRRRAA